MSVSQWFPCCFDVKFRVFFTDWRSSRIHAFLAQIGVDSFPFEPVQGYPVLLGTQAMVILMGFHGGSMEISMEIRQEDHMCNAFVPSFIAWPSHSTWDVTFHQPLDWSRYMGGNTVAFDMSVGKPVLWVHRVRVVISWGVSNTKNRDVMEKWLPGLVNLQFANWKITIFKFGKSTN